MKNFFKLTLTVICLTLATLFLFGCAASPSGGGAGGGYYPGGAGGAFTDGETSDATPSAPTGGEEGYDDTDESGEASDKGQNAYAGLMTAGAHDDNLYYQLYTSLFLKGQTAAEDGKFLIYKEKDDWGVNTLDRIKVTVENDGAKVSNANVIFTDNEEKVVYSAQTNSAGVAYLFGNDRGGKITVISGEGENTVAVSQDDTEVTVTLDKSAQKGKNIEIMLVVDVTGSMGDEITYLKNELSDVVNRVVKSFGDAKVKLALLFYRDEDDAEEFAYSDFLDVTDSKNLTVQQSFINKQKASGGGDYPEAVDEALEIAVSKQWSDNATKIIFHVLDAPPHAKAADKARYKKALLSASEKGIRICPILASGADVTTEYLTRQAAVMTGGTFVFITDHSGIGNSHLDPEIPNVVIEKLNDLMVRLIKGYYVGEFEDPVSYNGKTYFTIDSSAVQDKFIVSGAKRAYAAGDTVTIYTCIPEETALYTNPVTTLYVDGVAACIGERVSITVDENGEETKKEYLEFTFEMPSNNVVISFETVWDL